MGRGRPKHPDILTPRESEVVALIRAGLSNEEIAQRLDISPDTAKYHVSQILRKLDVPRRRYIARWEPGAAQPSWPLVLAPIVLFRRVTGALLSSKVLSIAAGGIAVAAVATLAVLGALVLRNTADGGGSAQGHVSTPTLPQNVVASTPTSARPPSVTLGSFWFIDAESGWLSAQSCRDQPLPAIDDLGRVPTQSPALCLGVLWRTIDGGQTWSEVYRGVGAPRDLLFANANRGVSLENNVFCSQSPCRSSILTTQDGGRSWKESYSTAQRLSNLSLVDGVLWVTGDPCGRDERGPCTPRLITSSDLGATWGETVLPFAATSVNVSRLDRSNAWIATMEGGGPGTARLYVTDDGGRSWQELPHPVRSSVYANIVSFASLRLGWVMVGGQPGAGSQLKELYATEDGGETWSLVAGTLSPDRLGEVHAGDLGPVGYVSDLKFISEYDGWIVLRRAGLLHSEDGGRTWRGSLWPVESIQYQFVDDIHGWGIVSPRELRATSDGGETWQTLTLPAAPDPTGSP